MRISFCCSMAVCFLGGWFGYLRADDQADCKPILEKTVKAMGGEKTLGHLKSGSLKGRFVISANGSEVTGSVESIWQGPEKCIFEIKPLDNQGNNASLKTVLNGENLQWEVDGTIVDGDSSDLGLEVNPIKGLLNSICLPRLLASMANKDAKLSHLGETKIKDRECAGLRMKLGESADASVFFDNLDGLPTKT